MYLGRGTGTCLDLGVAISVKSGQEFALADALQVQVAVIVFAANFRDEYGSELGSI